MDENIQAQIQEKIGSYQARANELDRTIETLQAQSLMLKGAAKGLAELLKDMDKEVAGGAMQPGQPDR
ncbi:MAG TPA: hypothetical protein VFF68_04550 [Anaerolineaceae bacterium]|nr:hypothetical protein [Anaerolineaceae bacterium]